MKREIPTVNGVLESNGFVFFLLVWHLPHTPLKDCLPYIHPKRENFHDTDNDKILFYFRSGQFKKKKKKKTPEKSRVKRTRCWRRKLYFSITNGFIGGGDDIRRARYFDTRQQVRYIKWGSNLRLMNYKSVSLTNADQPTIRHSSLNLTQGYKYSI